MSVKAVEKYHLPMLIKQFLSKYAFLFAAIKVFYLWPLNFEHICSFLRPVCAMPVSEPPTVTMKLHEFSQFRLELLQHFYFSDKDIMERTGQLFSLFFFPVLSGINLLTKSFKSFVCTSWVMISTIIFRIWLTCWC